MTQAELAQRIGVTRQTIIAIEQGRYSPSLEMAFQIAHAFNVTLDDVFRYETRRSHDMTTPTTTERGRRAPLPPRWVIRTAWTIHRAIYAPDARPDRASAARHPSSGG